MIDPPEVIRKKFKSAVTDSGREIRHDPEKPGVANLIEIYAALRGVGADAALAEFEGKRYSELKGAVADAVIDALRPIQARYAELRADDEGLRRVLAESAARVRVVADATLLKVQEAVGLR